MIKEYKKSGWDIIEIKFLSLYQYLQYLSNCGVNSRVFKKMTGQVDYYDWTKTRDYREAYDLCSGFIS